eukprot:jgi/Astpho2/9065/Aster-02724
MLPFVKLPKEQSTTTKAAEAAEATTQTGASSGGGMQGMFSKFRRPHEAAEAVVPLPGTAAGAGGRSRKLLPGRPMPHIILSTVQATGVALEGGRIEVGAPTGKWQLIVIYRGKHCPVSRNYLASIQQLHYELDEMGCEVLAVSADGREKAEGFAESLRATAETKDINIRIAYGMTVIQMRIWGLFISKPRNVREADGPFPEPAMFLLNPEGYVHICEYSNSPFSRPDLRILIEGRRGIRYIEEESYPVRGTYGILPIIER